MTISAVGSTASASGQSRKTLAVSPTAIGDVLVLAVAHEQTTAHITAVSGGGVTTWALLKLANPGSNEGDSELWWGVVTATGASTITITVADTGFDITLFARQFTGGSSGTWAADGSGAASTSTSTAGSGNYPSVTPAGASELYLGCGYFRAGTPGGSSSGFVYANVTTTWDGTGGQFVYNLAASNPTAYAPPWNQNVSNNWSACSALLTFTPGVSSGFMAFF